MEEQNVSADFVLTRAGESAGSETTRDARTKLVVGEAVSAEEDEEEEEEYDVEVEMQRPDQDEGTVATRKVPLKKKAAKTVAGTKEEEAHVEVALERESEEGSAEKKLKQAAKAKKAKQLPKSGEESVTSDVTLSLGGDGEALEAVGSYGASAHAQAVRRVAAAGDEEAFAEAEFGRDSQAGEVVAEQKTKARKKVVKSVKGATTGEDVSSEISEQQAAATDEEEISTDAELVRAGQTASVEHQERGRSRVKKSATFARPGDKSVTADVSLAKEGEAASAEAARTDQGASLAKKAKSMRAATEEGVSIDVELQKPGEDASVGLRQKLSSKEKLRKQIEAAKEAAAEIQVSLKYILSL